MKEKEYEKEYIQNTYGLCLAKECKCLKSSLDMQLCLNWKPTTAESWQQLLKEQMEKYR